ncbi:MAG: DUF1016 domain-containing protein [Treponema sp.]|nr:DUF1016 domain-containing protein [Treponema sp.]
MTIDDKKYFIDLPLYHRELRCLVAVELKIGEFQLPHNSISVCSPTVML